eukprot:scaffold9217_cov119-Isochrysis_galbana.AAC.1
MTGAGAAEGSLPRRDPAPWHCERCGAAWVPGLRRLRPPPPAAGSVERAGQAPERHHACPAWAGARQARWRATAYRARSLACRTGRVGVSVLDQIRRPTWPCGSPLRQRRRAGVRRDGGRCGTERRER